MDQLQVVKIEKEYEGKPLLKGISFEVSQGEVLCLLGKSGSGKSTLLRIIAGLESAESGQVLWNGQDMSNVPTHLRHFGLMFQDYALFPHLNVADNIAFGLRMQGEAKEEVAQKIHAALNQVNLAGFEQRQVTDLSGGEQQRVALVRALAPAPRLLMLDEPLAALDRALRSELQEELREVLHKADIPAIYVTHDQDEALALGDRLALLHEGEVVQIGTPEEVYRHPRSRWVAEFLGLNNLVTGKVVSTEPLQIDTPLGFLTAASPECRLKTGETITVLILDAGFASLDRRTGQNMIPMTVDECNFRGDHFQLKVHHAGHVTLSIKSNSRVEPGAQISVRLDPANILCLKA